MSFRLVPNSVTLDDLDSRNLCVMPPNSVAFGTDYVKVVEDTRILSVAERRVHFVHYHSGADNPQTSYIFSLQL